MNQEFKKRKEALVKQLASITTQHEKFTTDEDVERLKRKMASIDA